MKTRLKLIVMDVDGTMTDSGIYYDIQGNELKRFSTRDAAGIFAARAAGIKTMVLTGRECPATTRRMNELSLDYVFQGVKDKYSFLKTFLEENNYNKDEVGYIGDDLNDIAPMKLCGFKGCPADSCHEVTEIADYVSILNGGHGAIRDVVEHILTEYGEWEKTVRMLYGCKEE